MECPLCFEKYTNKEGLKTHILTCIDFFFPEETVRMGEKECVICFIDEECVDLECAHSVCLEGLTGHTNASVEQDLTLVCPHADCDKPILSPFLREKGVEKELVERLEQMELRKALERDTIPCPFPNCENRFIVEEGVKNIFCEKCTKFFCKDCKELSHYGVNCEEFKNAKALNDDQAHQMLMKDERWKEENCRLCPECGSLVNKINGCNIIRCGGDPHGIGKITYRINQQKGCGKEFDWIKANPYKSQMKIKIEHVKLEKVPNICATCGKTNEMMMEERNVCLNCEGVMFCKKCVLKGRKHDKTHLIYTIPKEIKLKPQSFLHPRLLQPEKKPKPKDNLGGANYNRRTVFELKGLLAERRIEGRSKLNTKARMIERLEQWDRDNRKDVK